MSSHGPHRQPTTPAAQVDTPADLQLRLDEAFERLRTALAGRQKQALHGVSPQYLSAVLHRQTTVSLKRFVQLLTTGCTLGQQAFVLGALVTKNRAPAKPPMVELAEAAEATGEAIGHAARIFGARSVSPRDLVALRERVLRAQRELEDVAYAIGGAT